MVGKVAEAIEKKMACRYLSHIDARMTKRSLSSH
jgi:hypothetical protein